MNFYNSNDKPLKKNKNIKMTYSGMHKLKSKIKFITFSISFPSFSNNLV